MSETSRNESRVDHPGGPELSETKARQASSRPFTFWVMLISTILATIAVGIVLLLFLGSYNKTPAENPPVSQTLPNKGAPPVVPGEITK